MGPPSAHLPCRVCASASPFLLQQLWWGGGQYFKRFPSSLLPFLDACQSLSYGKRDKGSDFMSAWTRISNPRLKKKNNNKDYGHYLSS